MESKTITIERLEKELQGKMKVKKWAFIGGLATVGSAFLDIYSNPYGDRTYALVQILLAAGCLGWSLFLTYDQKKLETALAALRTDSQGTDEE